MSSISQCCTAACSLALSAGAPSAYISYSRQACDKHQEECFALVAWLRTNGVEAIADFYNTIECSADPPRWIEREMEKANFVICVLSPAYKEVWSGGELNSSRLNCDRTKLEASLVRMRRERDAHAVIPVLLRGTEATDCIPPLLDVPDKHVVDPYEDTAANEMLLCKLHSVKTYEQVLTFVRNAT